MTGFIDEEDIFDAVAAYRRDHPPKELPKLPADCKLHRIRREKGDIWFIGSAGKTAATIFDQRVAAWLELFIGPAIDVDQAP